jgi:hypothetical protein
MGASHNMAKKAEQSAGRLGCLRLGLAVGLRPGRLSFCAQR